MEAVELERFGLTRNEAKVYLALLEEGVCGANAIVKRTSLHAPRVYESLDRLASKGLASFVYRGKRKEFEASSPKQFQEILDETKLELDKVMPKLLELEGRARSEHKATVYVGEEGIRSVMKSILEELNPKGRYDDFGVSGLFRDVMGPFWDYWQQKKRKYGIKSRCIFDERIKNNGRFVKDYFGTSRFVSRKYYNPTDTFIFRDKILMCMWEANPPLAILIEDRGTAMGYKRYFSIMWRQAKK